MPGAPIGFSDGKGKIGIVEFHHFATGDQARRILNPRGKELIVTMQAT